MLLLFDGAISAVAYKFECVRQPFEILWIVVILAFIALSLLEILKLESVKVSQRIYQNFFILLFKILAGIFKIHLCNASLKSKTLRTEYQTNRYHKDVDRQQKDNDDDQYIMNQLIND